MQKEWLYFVTLEFCRGMGDGRGPRGVTCSDKVFKARLAFLSAELSGYELRALQRPYPTQIYPVMTLAFPQIIQPLFVTSSLWKTKQEQLFQRPLTGNIYFGGRKTGPRVLTSKRDRQWEAHSVLELGSQQPLRQLRTTSEPSSRET